MHKHTHKTITFCLITLITTCLLANVTFAIHPDRWEHTTEADFESGVAENVLITNLGDIKLAADTKLMDAIPQLGSVIFDLHESKNGTIYIASGPQSAIIRKTDDQIDVLIELPTEQVFSLGELPQGNLLLGISGTPSRLAYLDHQDKIQTLIELPEVRYIWDMIVRNDSVLLATGTEGQLLKVSLNAQNPDGQKPATKKVEDKPQPQTQPTQSPIKSNPIQHERLDNPQNITDNVTMTQVDIEPEFATAKEPEPQSTEQIVDDPTTDDQEQTDKPIAEDSPVQEAPTLPKKITDIPPVIITYQPTVTVLYDASQTNLLCLGQDKLQRIYVGTDTDGLIYRFTEKSDGSVTAFVLYDASEPEIGAILVMSDGTTYAGTADANQARPGRLSKASNKQVGRPNVTQSKPKTPIKPPHQTPT
ncbi:MAG: hypothetical protein JKX85_14335, partial [Phycisphaeraceae bacterium]|nr:hypothetical protein [Phycisphaeraceae bacterium]